MKKILTLLFLVLLFSSFGGNFVGMVELGDMEVIETLGESDERKIKVGSDAPGHAFLCLRKTASELPQLIFGLGKRSHQNFYPLLELFKLFYSYLFYH